MKNLVIASSILVISTVNYSQNRGGNVAQLAQTNVNINKSLSNVSNVSNYNLNQSNTMNNGLSNIAFASNDNVVSNRRQEVTNQKVSRSNPVRNVNNRQRTIPEVTVNPVSIQNNGSRNLNVRSNNVNLELDNVYENEQRNEDQSYVQSINVSNDINVKNDDQIILPEEVANIDDVQVKFSPDLNVNVDISIPKPTIVFDLKVKEEKVKSEKEIKTNVTKVEGVAKVKSKLKFKNRDSRKGHHYYSQKVGLSLVVKNTISKLQYRFKKTSKNKVVCSVVCYKF